MTAKKDVVTTVTTEGQESNALVPVNNEQVKIGDTLVKGKMKLSYNQTKISTMIRKKKKLRFDLSIQRNNVWTDYQKSMLMHSVLDEYPIPQIFVEASDDDQLWALDGKQRLSSIFGYVANEFPLLKDTPAVLTEDEEGNPFYVEVEGKFFKELSKELQEQIMDYTLSIVEVKNITSQEQREELFQRLNSGSSLTKIELTRAKAGVEIMEFVNKVADTKFFSDYASLSDKQRNRFVDQELILQTLALAMGRETGISSKEIEAFVKALKQDEITDDIRQMFFSTTQYLEDSFRQFIKYDDKGREDFKTITKFTKKIHIPMLFLTALEAIKEDVSPTAYGIWAKDFFDNRYKSGQGSYGSHTQSSVAKVTSVNGRIRALKADFADHIRNAVEVANSKLAEQVTNEVDSGKDQVASSENNQETA